MGTIICEMLSDAMVVYTDGDIRKQRLEKIFKKNYCQQHSIIMDVRELGYGTAQDKKREVTVCPNHKVLNKVVCALHNAKAIRSYALSGSEEMEWIDDER